jgi:putative heme iron utilization protein
MPTISINELRTEIFKMHEDFNSSLQSTAAPQSSIPLKSKVINAYTLMVLNRLKNIFSADKSPEEINTELKSFLTENWDLINGTMLAYTAMPEHDITKLLCSVAEFVSENGSKAINLLMPTVNCASIVENYPDLDSLPLAEVLKTHILGREGKYLIPIAILLDDNFFSLDIKLKTARNNPYYDYQAHSVAMALLTSEEIARVEKHSTFTDAIVLAINRFEMLINDKSNLLGHINKFVQELTFNSVRGVGNEYNAAKGVYDSILAFYEYYDSLDERLKNQIPEVVLDVINKIRNIGSSVGKEKDNNDLDRCIAMLRDELEKAINANNNKEIIASIGITEEKKSLLIKEIIEQFSVAKETLKKLMDDEGAYYGEDKLPVTLELLRKLNINFVISSNDDLKALLELNPKEITEIIQNMPADIVRVIGSIENLVILIINTPDEKIEALLSAISFELQRQLLTKPQDLAMTLIALRPDQITIVCKVLGENLYSTFITNTTDLGNILANLNPEQRNVIYAVMKSRLVDFIGSLLDLDNFLKYFPEKKHEIYVAMMKNGKLLKIITFADILQYILECSPEKKQEIYDAMMKSGELLKIFTFVSDLQRILEHFPEKKEEIYCMIKNKLSEIIMYDRDLVIVLNCFPEKKQEIYDAMMKNGKLLEIIMDDSDLVIVLNCFPEKKQELYDTMMKNGKLLEIIAFAEWLKPVLEAFPENKQEIYGAMMKSGKLLEIITHADSLKDVLKCFPENKQEIYDAMMKSGKLLEIITGADSLKQILECFPEKEQEIHSILEEKNSTSDLPKAAMTM